MFVDLCRVAAWTQRSRGRLLFVVATSYYIPRDPTASDPYGSYREGELPESPMKRGIFEQCIIGGIPPVTPTGAVGVGAGAGEVPGAIAGVGTPGWLSEGGASATGSVVRGA